MSHFHDRLTALEQAFGITSDPDVFHLSRRQLLETTASIIAGVPPPVEGVPDPEASLAMWEAEPETFDGGIYVTTSGERHAWPKGGF